MKILLLLANTSQAELMAMKNTVITVFNELEVIVKSIQLESLPYFRGESSVVMEEIEQNINDSSGIIALCNVHLNGIHGAMQTFFDYLSYSNDVILEKPLLTITYSNLWGEVEAAYQISKGWRFLGGIDAGLLAFNSYIEQPQRLKILEKQLENFYRIIKQGMPNIVSSERQLFMVMSQGGNIGASMGSNLVQTHEPDYTQNYNPNQGHNQGFNQGINQGFNQGHNQAHNLVQAPNYRGAETAFAPTPVRNHPSEEELEIAEITSLLKGKMTDDDPMATYNNTYGKPAAAARPAVFHHKPQRRVASLPHYFMSQFSSGLDIVIQYIVNDTKEQGYVVVRNGHCEYAEGVVDRYTIEVTLIDSVLEDIINKIISYQKAFMVGKIKVKGNFAILPKLDQIFRDNKSY